MTTLGLPSRGSLWKCYRRLSDRMLRKMMAENGGLIQPEVRSIAIAFYVICILIVLLQDTIKKHRVKYVLFSWICHSRRLGDPCPRPHRRCHYGTFWRRFLLCVCSLLSLREYSGKLISHHRMMYSSMLAYIVDANIGRSSGAVATSTFFRGILAFISLETAVPMQV